jgi:hypothetical protein
VVLQTGGGGGGGVKRERVFNFYFLWGGFFEGGVSSKEREDVTESTCGCVGNGT